MDNKVPTLLPQKFRVYIAGPYTKPDPIENSHRIMKLANQVYDLGFIPFVPHMNLMWHLVCPRPAKDWYEYDLYWLEQCHVLLRDKELTPGESWGSDREEEFARARGVPIVYSLNELIRWARN